MKLLIDSGNTRLKWAVMQDGELMSSYALVNLRPVGVCNPDRNVCKLNTNKT